MIKAGANSSAKANNGNTAADFADINHKGTGLGDLIRSTMWVDSNSINYSE